MREHDISIRTDWQTAVSPGGGVLSEKEFGITLGDQGLLRCTVTSDGSTAFPFTGLALRFGVRAVLEPGTPGEVPLSDLLVFSEGAENINVAGDWDEVSEAGGKMSVRYNAKTDVLQAVFKACGAISIHGLAELETENAAGEVNTIGRWPVTLTHEIVDAEPLNPVSSPEYVRQDVFDIAVAKLDGIEDGATADQTAGEIKTAYESNPDTNAFTDAEKTKLGNQSGTNTGDQDLSGLQPKPAEGAFADGDKTKIDGIEDGADVTDTDNVRAAGALMDDEVTNLPAVKSFDPADYATAAQGDTADTAVQPGDLATVATSGAYSDLSGTPDLSVYDNFEPYTNEADFPAVGDADVLYLETSSGNLFRWTGAAYVTISAQLALGETSATAYRGDRGKTAYDHSQLVSGNPHSVSKADVDLGNVDNTADLDKPVSTPQQAALNDKQNILSEGPFEDGDKTKLSALMSSYWRDSLPARSAANEMTVSDTYVRIDGDFYRTGADTVIDLTASASWDTTTPTDYTVAANRAGTDIYLYACVPSSGTVPDLLLSANASNPSGYTTSTSVQIGGFHCLCAAVGTISGHALSGWLVGDILPQSIWDLDHRSSGTQEGTVYDPQTQLWVDIYLASWSGTEMQSVDGGTIADGATNPDFHWYNFVELFGAESKRLPTQDEFIRFTRGSNQETNISGSSDPVTTGGHSDTAGRRMISDIGLEDACGVMWQWGADMGHEGEAATTWRSADTTSDATTYDGDTGVARGESYGNPNRPLFGGFWFFGSLCGSRCAFWLHSPLLLSSSFGARGVAEPYAL